MSKKSLSDLLREEVHKTKTSTSESSEPHELPAQSSHRLGPTEDTSMNSPMNLAKGESAKVGASPTPPKPVSSSHLTKAELEGKVVSLTEALVLAQQFAAEQESSLAQQITQLESTVAEQHQSIQQLQVSLDQARSIKSELDLAKKDALKLAQENERLQSQNQELKTELASSQVPSQASSMASPKATSKVMRQPSLPPPSRSILERPIKPAQSPTQTGKSSKSFDTWCYD